MTAFLAACGLAAVGRLFAAVRTGRETALGIAAVVEAFFGAFGRACGRVGERFLAKGACRCPFI